jgi:hypothetical protein
MKRKALFILGAILLALHINGQIIPYLQIPTSESVIVNWRSQNGTESKVYYGEEKDGLNQIAVGTAELFSGTNDNNYAYVYHSVKLRSLKPNTLYYYKVEHNNNQSAVYSFKTQPQAGASGVYRFIILGDHQLTDGRYERLMNAAKRVAEQKYGTPVENHINLITNVGDQVNEGSLKQYDQVHFKTSELLSPNLPIATIVGNHETYADANLDLYKKHYFNNEYGYKGIRSNTSFYYAMQQGRVLFLMLSSEHPGTTQKRWVEQVIEKAKTDSEIDWIFSFNHRPIQAEQYVGDVSTWIRDEIMPLLNTTEKSVMNVAGHHHLYHRGQLRDYPTYHIISGGASWDQRWGQSIEKDFDDVQKTIDYWPFQIVETDSENRSVTVETYIIGNQAETFPETVLIDRFSRTIGKPKPNKPSVLPLSTTEIELPYTFQSSAYSTTTEYAYKSVQFQIASDENFSKPEFDLIRDYENIFGAHPSGGQLVDLHKDIDIFRQTITKEQLFNGTHYIRVRHRDRNLEWSDWSEYRSFTTKGGSDGPTSLSLNKKQYQPGENIEMTYNYALNQNDQWIGIYAENKVPGAADKSVKWSSAPGVSGSKTFMLENAGVYFAALFRDGGYIIQAKTDPFFVGKIPVLEADKNVFMPNEPIGFRFSNAPNLTKDWIGLYKEGQTPGKENSLKWQYISSGNGSISFSALSVGDYFISYFMQDGYYEPGERIYVQVQAPAVETNIVRTDNKNKLSIISNPESNQIRIRYLTNKPEQLKLYNASGHLVQCMCFTNDTVIETQKLSTGVYLLHIGKNVTKVIVKK